jgi:phenylpropionate dioxygenase-like ring-hydroxylating dioxygenase large terminal subunit
VTFLKNIWYVAAWSHELGADAPLGLTIIGEPVALYRRSDGSVVAFEDRCPHRHAPLSLGRIEGDDLRCMYHGLRFGRDGVCVEIPGTTKVPPRTQVRVFPALERSSWIWVWMGDPALADASRVPHATGLDDPEWVMRSGGIDYAADYQLVNDNLCDLSHLDFVHETTLGGSTGAKWSAEAPKITAQDDGLLIERWFRDHLLMPGRLDRVDTWNSYRYVLPGVFVMTTESYPVGTAQASGLGPPGAKALYRRVEQQAVTPIGDKRTRYLYATGVEKAIATPRFIEGVFKVVNESFAEDRRMIEGQQKIWDLTPPERQRAFLPQDQAPALFRRMLAARLAEEQRA